MDKILKLQDVSFSYGDKLIVDSVSLDIQHGEIVTIVGPSGCGKSTLLRLISRLETPQLGNIKINQVGKEQTTLRYLFQDYDAFPWDTVWDNVKMAVPNKTVSDDEVESILNKLGILESRNKYPKELSVGMRKRLGLARCLIAKPTLLLLDEPFAALDVDTKLETYSILQSLQQEYGQTIIMITHDLQEAVLLGGKIIISTKLPFKISSVVNIPFGYPRTDKLYSETIFQELTNQVRKGISYNI